MRNEKNIAGMARFGISSENTLGVSMPDLRKIGKQTGKNHTLALEVWDSGIHEAKILASIIDDHKLVTAGQMDKWVNDFDSWDVCDQVCMNLFRYTPFAHKKAAEWAGKQKEFVKRAGYAMMACLASGDKKAADADFIKFFPLIKKAASDERNFVRKAVNWALRQIGKRNRELNKASIKLADEIIKMKEKSAKWIAGDALRELKSPEVQKRLK